jgi:hypothetical protein
MYSRNSEYIDISVSSFLDEKTAWIGSGIGVFAPEPESALNFSEPLTDNLLPKVRRIHLLLPSSRAKIPLARAIYLLGSYGPDVGYTVKARVIFDNHTQMVPGTDFASIVIYSFGTLQAKPATSHIARFYRSGARRQNRTVPPTGCPPLRQGASRF